MTVHLPVIKPLNDRNPEEKELALKHDKLRHQTLKVMRAKISGNNTCADCFARSPGWAALPHGIFICVDCAQVHRGIGRHISQVKSIVSGTYIWYEDEVDAMKQMGNRKANRLYMWNFPGQQPPPSVSRGSSRSEIASFIRQKYVQQLWIAQHNDIPRSSRRAEPTTRLSTADNRHSALDEGDRHTPKFQSVPRHSARELSPLDPPSHVATCPNPRPAGRWRRTKHAHGLGAVRLTTPAMDPPTTPAIDPPTTTAMDPPTTTAMDRLTLHDPHQQHPSFQENNRSSSTDTPTFHEITIPDGSEVVPPTNPEQDKFEQTKTKIMSLYLPPPQLMATTTSNQPSSAWTGNQFFAEYGIATNAP